MVASTPAFPLLKGSLPAPRHGDLEPIERKCVPRLVNRIYARPLVVLVGPAGSGKSIILHQMAMLLASQGAGTHFYEPKSGGVETAANNLKLWLSDLSSITTRDHAERIGPEISPATKAGFSDNMGFSPGGSLSFVILESYEKIDTMETGNVVREFLLKAGHRFHVVIATRRKTNLQISDLCTQGHASVVGGDELFFSDSEIGDFFHSELETDEVHLVAEQTRGWPVALRFVKLLDSNRGFEQSAHKRTAISGHEIVNYIEEQVVSSLDRELLELLHDISLLQRIEPGIVDHIRSRDDSSRLLERLIGFLPGLIERHDTSFGEEYSLHPYLRCYARTGYESDPAKRMEIHTRAVSWFRSRLMYSDAIPHALSSQVPGELDSLLDSFYSWRIFLNGGVSELLAILKSLPRSEVETRPRLRLMAALAHFKSGLYLESYRILFTVRSETDGFRNDAQGNSRALFRDGTMLEAFFMATLSGVNVDEALFDRACEAAGIDDALAWGSIAIARCVVFEMRGDLTAAMEAWKGSDAIFQGASNAVFTERWLPYHPALIALSRGAFREASDLVARLVKIHRHPAAVDAPSAAMSKLLTAAITYERRFVEESSAQAQEALDLLGRGNSWFVPCALAYPIMFEVAHRIGGVAEVSTVAAEARRRGLNSGIADLDDLIDALEAAWLIRAGRIDGLAPTIERIQALLNRAGHLPWRLFDAQTIALCLWFFAHRQFENALASAKSLIEAGRRGGRLRSLAKGRLLQAIATNALGDKHRAMKELESVLGLAAHEQMVALFAEEGSAVSAMIANVASSLTASAAARRQAATIMRVIPLVKGDTASLNEKETKIAQYLRDGASNKVIARQLGLTENTIKFHMKRIFVKLGVTNRQDAAFVAHGERLRLEA